VSRGALIAFVSVLLVTCACRMPREQRQTHAGQAHRIVITGTKPATPVPARGDMHRFTWQDINTRKVVDRKGDTFVVDVSVKPSSLSLAVTIDRERLADVIASFGYPDSWCAFSYRTEQERRQKQAELGRKLQSRGFELVGEDEIRVDYEWVVDSSRQDMRPVAEGIVGAARDAGYEDARAFTGGVTSFVQSLDYRQPDELRRNQRGELVNTGGVTMPLETIANRAGDCDTKALLLASILVNVRGAGILLLEGNEHVFVGLRMSPREGDHYVKVQGIEYVLVEVTSPWPLGSIPEDVMAGLARNEYNVVPVE
jgi:hypothetical protein